MPTSTAQRGPKSDSAASLLFWPLVVTMVVGVSRYLGETFGFVGTGTGGGLHPLGVTWLAFPVGVWMSWRLVRSGSRPRLSGMTPLVAVALLIAIAVTVATQFGSIPREVTAESNAQLVAAVSTIAIVASIAAGLALLLWPRLGILLLCYALPTRLGVVGLTVIAKLAGQDTHYVKFGPQGLEYPFGQTLWRASFAQLGFWVPFTIVAGMAAGSFVALIAARRSR